MVTVSPSVATVAARVRVHSGVVGVAVVRSRVSLQRPPLEALSTQMVAGVAAWAGVKAARPRSMAAAVRVVASLARVWVAGVVVWVISLFLLWSFCFLVDRRGVLRLGGFCSVELPTLRGESPGQWACVAGVARVLKGVLIQDCWGC